MNSCEATGPCAITCSLMVVVVSLPPASVVVTVCGSTSWTRSYGLRFCTTPCDTSSSEPTTQNGNSTHSVARVMSTQKFPSVSRSRPAMPRMKAIARAMPAAAETKL